VQAAHLTHQLFFADQATKNMVAKQMTDAAEA